MSAGNFDGWFYVAHDIGSAVPLSEYRRSIAEISTARSLALLLGSQAAAVKHIGIRDLSTVVVTMTMVNLASDSRLAGGRGHAWSRRVGAIVMMGLGALAAAAVVLHLGGGAYALLLAGVLMGIATLLMGQARRRDIAAHELATSAS